MFRCKKASKRGGFTLLETLLAVAILLIVSLMAFEGFMTTLNYSGDTALAERVSNENTGECYKVLGARIRTDDDGNSIYYPVTAGIRVADAGSNYTNTFQIYAQEAAAGNSVFAGSSAASYDSSNFTSTADRHCFVYVPRLCTECGTALGYFYNEDTHVLSCKCINKDCTNYGVDIPYKTCNVTDIETDTEEEGD